jgi:hypothetical protein
MATTQNPAFDGKQRPLQKKHHGAVESKVGQRQQAFCL